MFSVSFLSSFKLMFTRESLIEFIEQFEPLRMRFFVWVSFQIFNVDIQRVR